MEELNRYFFQRGNADGQQAHQKMLDITNHQGNANQNHSEIPPHTCQNSYHHQKKKQKQKQKGTQTINVSKDVEKRKPYTLLVGRYIGAGTVGNCEGF